MQSSVPYVMHKSLIILLNRVLSVLGPYQKNAQDSLPATTSRSDSPRSHFGSIRLASKRTLHQTAAGDSSYRAPVSGGIVADLTPEREEPDHSSNGEGIEDHKNNTHSDEEEGRAGVTLPSEVRLSPVATCLAFLFFAFEGAVASQAAAIRSTSCPEFSIAAAVALVSQKPRP